ncbi:tRNA1(Val) (adenine(37)-N6)-methyltransferase [Lonsdalea populi]|uniref:tRNA1(Val) (adenine(37)-N6)-methyltransferase n=2 Tax=Lonsdalea populi TaxID=1172565 RepID=A0A3N0U8C5_9GAMM|nr:tRNA1(Val) (adenine(37)-N6)-methyltransferase [Lonsdalea populi]ROH78321.1 tRNA1(Val) (adenine(37)-N6)-methyltransferase [Lonsdalea populi]
MLARFNRKRRKMTQPLSTPTVRSGGFTFKQFFVAHDRCAMKVGTDGILLGAWAPLPKEGRLLDIGCGSGVIALMLAQRTLGRLSVDGVELDVAAGQQAKENAAASPWRDQVTIYTADIADFAGQNRNQYALIVSNPPYFAPGVSCRSESRTQARYTTSLTHQELLRCAKAKLMTEGLFCVVLPYDVAEAFIPQAEKEGWCLSLRTDVREFASRPAHRTLLALSLMPGVAERSSLVIRDDDGHYSDAYRALTSNFYLSM